jgi:hypothetical protein
MNIKKILTYSVVSASLLTGAAYAGGPDVIAPVCPVCVSSFVPFAYLGVSAGWAFSDWNNFILSGSGADADTNGFAFGGKLGFQFSDHFGIEGGAFMLPDSDQSVHVVDEFGVPHNLSGEVDSWFAYGAATIRASLPINPFFHFMGKVGGVYRALNRSGNLYEDVGNGSYATVIFGAGFDYDLGMYNLPLAVGVDYLYVPGSNDSFFAINNKNIPIVNQDAAPAAQVVVATLSLRFAV